MERIGLGIDVQADSSQAVKGFNELNKAIDAVKNNSKGLNAANDPFSLAQLERKKERLPSFIQDFGKKDRHNPFFDIPDAGRFSNISDNELLRAFQIRNQLENKISQDNDAISKNKSIIRQIKDEFNGEKIPFYKQEEIKNRQKWNDVLKNDKRQTEKHLNSIFDVNENDLKERLNFRIAGGELQNDKNDRGDIKGSIEEIIKELQSINKNTKDNDNNLPSSEQMGQTAPESTVPNGNSLAKTLSYALKGSPYAIAAKAVIDTATNVFEDNSQIRNTQRSHKLGMLNGDILSAESAAHNIAYLKNKRTLDVASGSAIASGVVLGAGIGSVVPGLGTAIGAGAGLVIGGAAAAYAGIAKKIEATRKAEEDSKSQFMHGMSSVYQTTLPMYEQGVSVFYDRKNKNFDSDLSLFRTGRLTLSDVFQQYARDTGLSTADFGSLAIELAKQGIGENHPETASAYTRRAAQWANYTGGNAGDYQSFLALEARFNKERANSLDIAYGASQASGLGRAQFGEFLQGLESVVSSGISKGFVRSTEDVSKTMAMLSMASNGSELWKGTQGAERLNQISSGIANATSLSSTTQILAYQAFRQNGLAIGANDKSYIKGQDVLNTLAAMEHGLDSKNFYKIGDSFKNAFGRDIMQNVMAWKELSGLNISGAMQLYNMYNKGEIKDGDLTKKINDLKKDPAYSSDKTIQQNMLNELQTMGEKLGMPYFHQEIHKLDEYVRDIAAEITKDKKGSFYYDEQYSKYRSDIIDTKRKMYKSGEINHFINDETATELAYQKFMRADSPAFQSILNYEAKKLYVQAGKSQLWQNTDNTIDAEKNRLQKILDEMYESRRDDDKTNDKQISDYDERYKSALLQLLPLIERIANASEKTAANTNEVELN